MATSARVVPRRAASAATSGSSMRQKAVTPRRSRRPVEMPARSMRVSVATGQPRRKASTPAAMARGWRRAAARYSRSALVWIMRRTTNQTSGGR